jgi:hypothetical protein
MSDYFPGSIEIGGKVPKALAQELVDAVVNAGAAEGDDWGGEGWEPETPEDLLKSAKESGGTLRLCNDQARYGEFDELEEFCRLNGIAYSRHSDAKYEYDAENVEFRPGMEGPETFFSNSSSNVQISQDEIKREVYPLLEKGKAKEALAKLKELAGENIPALEPLEFV